MPLESLYGLFGIVVLVDIKLCEFDGASIITHMADFSLLGALLSSTYQFASLVDVLVGIDKVCSIV